MRIEAPQYRAEFLAEMRARRARGLSTELVDVRIAALTDPPLHPLFARFIHVMDDGDSFAIDTEEYNGFIRAGLAH